MKKLNEYFFIEEGEEMHPLDGWWFYGCIGLCTVIMGLVLLSV